jgi:hypothetical protein
MMTDNVVYLYPTHNPDCPVVDGAERVRWCPIVQGPDGDMMATQLGTAMPCLPHPVWTPRRWRADTLKRPTPDGDAA